MGMIVPWIALGAQSLGSGVGRPGNSVQSKLLRRGG